MHGSVGVARMERSAIRGRCCKVPGCASLHPGYALRARNDSENHFPVFTLVHSRLMMRCVAGSRAWMTNSFFCVASSG